MTTLDWCCQRAVHAARRLAASVSDSLRHDSRSFVSGVAWHSFCTRASTMSMLSGDATPHPQNSRFASWHVSSDELDVSRLQRSFAVSLGLLDNERCCSVLHWVTSLQRTDQKQHCCSNKHCCSHVRILHRIVISNCISPPTERLKRMLARIKHWLS